MFVDAMTDVPALAREQSDVPVPTPRTVSELAAQVVVVELDSIRSAIGTLPGGEHSRELVPKLRGRSLVGVERENPLIPCGCDAGIPLVGDRGTGDSEHASAGARRELPCVVRRSAVDNDHFVGPPEIAHRLVDPDRLI